MTQPDLKALSERELKDRRQALVAAIEGVTREKEMLERVLDELFAGKEQLLAEENRRGMR